MGWHANNLYGQATPRLLELLLADPVLAPALHHVRELEHRFPKRRLAHGLPPGGLLAVRDVGPPDDRHEVEVPWDALFGARGPAPGFGSPALLAEQGLPEAAWPPDAALAYLKDLAHRAGAPISLYSCEMWGGDVELEAAWIFSGSPDEPDRVLFLVEPERIATAVGADVTVADGEVLPRVMEAHALRLPGWYFAPHTSLFDWERWRVRPSPPVSGPCTEYGDPPRRPVPRSLFRCVELGDREGAAALLAAGADPNAYRQETPLERAASQGSADLVALLLRAGAEAGKDAALAVAVDVASAALLVAAGAAVEPEEAEALPLVQAAREGRDALARWLVERGASVRPRGREGEVYGAACAGGLVWLVERALAEGGTVDDREHGDSGRTGLALAASHGRAEVVRLLLARGARLSEETWAAACSGGALELIDEHLERGQDVEAAVHGVSGLMLAAREGQGAAVRRLLERGADPTREFHGETILHAAAWEGSLAAVEALLASAPQELDRRSSKGWTPLFAAVWSEHREIAARLLAAGASVEVVDEAGRSLRAVAEQRGVSLARG